MANTGKVINVDELCHVELEEDGSDVDKSLITGRDISLTLVETSALVEEETRVGGKNVELPEAGNLGVVPECVGGNLDSKMEEVTDEVNSKKELKVPANVDDSSVKKME